MKLPKFKLALALLTFFLCSCDDLNLGMKYGKQLLARKGNTSIYCYYVSWTRDAVAYYISSNNDVCMGFDSTKDYCFGKGYQEIYYRFRSDTLSIFSYGKELSIPKRNFVNINIVWKDLTFDSVGEYEKKYKRKELEKVNMDSFYDVPCNLSNAPINPYNLKFK